MGFPKMRCAQPSHPGPLRYHESACIGCYGRSPDAPHDSARSSVQPARRIALLFALPSTGGAFRRIFSAPLNSPAASVVFALAAYRPEAVHHRPHSGTSRLIAKKGLIAPLSCVQVLRFAD